MKRRTRPTILVVDDDARWRRLIIDEIRRPDIEILTASTIADAHDCLERTKPALIVLDVLIGGKDGLEPSGLKLAETIRKHRSWRRIPIVFCTVVSSGKFRSQMETLKGEGAVFIKPFDFDHFTRAIQGILEKGSP